MNKNRVIVGDCGHVLGSADIEVWRAGIYYISYNVYHTEPFQCGMFLNGNLILDSIIGDQNAGNVCLNSLYLEILPADISQTSTISPSGLSAKITLRNYLSFSPIGVLVDGHQGSGSIIVQTNVNVTLFLLS